MNHDGLQWETSKACPHRPQSAARPPEVHRIECRDYSACDASARRGQRASSLQDYSDKPPSNWTSQSPGIQLHGPITCRLVKSCPLAGLVRSGLPGVIGVEATSCRRPSTVGWTTVSRAARRRSHSRSQGLSNPAALVPYRTGLNWQSPGCGRNLPEIGKPC